MIHSFGPIKASGRHSHESLTLGAIISGRRVLCINDSTYEVGPETVFCIAPNATHSCQSIDNCEYIIFSIPVSLAATLGFTAMLPAYTNPVIDSPDLFGMLIGLFDSMDESFFAMERQSQLVAIMVMLLKETPSAKPVLADVPQNIAQAVRFMKINHNVNVCLDELAQIAKLSPCRFNRRFAQIYGMPPHEFHNQIRMREAKRLIVKGTPLVETATYCGFTDQSHMNRIFKKLLGMTPGQYAKAFR